MSETNLVLNKEEVELILSKLNDAIENFEYNYVKGTESTLDSLYDANVNGHFKEELQKVSENVRAYFEACVRYYRAQYLIIENIKNSMDNHDIETSSKVSGG